MTTVAEAEEMIRQHMPVWPARSISIDEAAQCVLAEDVLADRDVPAFDRVTMDGIALAGAEFTAGNRTFAVAGTQAAGVAPMSLSDDSQCIRVMTGAVMPLGADSVIPVERLRIEDDMAIIDADAPFEHGQFVHRRGTDRPAGSVVIERSTRIGAPELAVLASVGQAQVTIAAIPRIAVVSTGDELVDVGEPVAAHQIRSSNDRAIEGALRRHNCGTATRVTLRDDPKGLLSTLESLHAEHDALILSGGVSMGDFDFVPGALKHLGAEVIFHRINQKPGRPMWFGISGAGKPIFALPGNPVSTLVCMSRYVLPALLRSAGLQPRNFHAVLQNDQPGGPANWDWFVPVRISSGKDGTLQATGRSINTSGDFASLAGSDGIAQLAPEDRQRRAGAIIPVYGW